MEKASRFLFPFSLLSREQAAKKREASRRLASLSAFFFLQVGSTSPQERALSIFGELASC